MCVCVWGGGGGSAPRNYFNYLKIMHSVVGVLIVAFFSLDIIL